MTSICQANIIFLDIFIILNIGLNLIRLEVLQLDLYAQPFQF